MHLSGKQENGMASSSVGPAGSLVGSRDLSIQWAEGPLDISINGGLPIRVEPFERIETLGELVMKAQVVSCMEVLPLAKGVDSPYQILDFRPEDRVLSIQSVH